MVSNTHFFSIKYFLKLVLCLTVGWPYFSELCSYRGKCLSYVHISSVDYIIVVHVVAS